MRSLWRFFKMALQNIGRNFWLSVITISMYVLTLATINVVLFVNAFAGEVTQSIEEKVEVTAYFKQDTSLDIVNAARGYITGFAEVREANVVTADDAYTAFRDGRAEDDPALLALEEIGENPFGHALVIRATEVGDFDFILSTLDGSQYAPYIDETDAQDNASLIQNITRFSGVVQIVGVALALFFGVVTFLMLLNTIRMAIYVHREEIGIMKLVGASDAYVRMPFLLEGMLYSVIACALFFVAIWILLGTGISLPSWFEGFDMRSLELNLFTVAIAETASAILVALFATWTAMTRHLKV